MVGRSNHNSAVPLADRCLFQSGDLDEAREIVAAKFCDHRLDRVSRAGRFDACHNRAEGQAVSLNFIRYGADVEIEPGELGSFYLIQIPVSGQADINNGGGDFGTGVGLGSVLNPHRHTRMRWREGCAQLLLQVDSGFLMRTAERSLGRKLRYPVTFQTCVDERNPKIKHWVNKLRTCFSLADKSAVFSGKAHPTQALVEEQLLEEFLRCQPSDISEDLESNAQRAKSVHIRKAIDYMYEHLADQITIGDIAKAVGKSSRSLQMGFKAELGKSPLQFLREERLKAARTQLMAGSAEDRVGEICEQAGFSHFGRFSVEYRKYFGEHPSETLARLS